MTRSSKKEPRFFVAPKLIKKVRELNEQNKKKLIRTWSRDSIIYPEMIGHTFEVHNGKIFNKVSITSEMVGRALGEFSPTRRSGVHGKAGTH